jgi:hypothetical protein
VAIRQGGNVVTLNRSQIYLNALALFTAGRVRLPNRPRLIRQLIGLQRRPGRSGHDTVDHPRGGADDIANVACACLVLLAGGARPLS